MIGFERVWGTRTYQTANEETNYEQVNEKKYESSDKAAKNQRVT